MTALSGADISSARTLPCRVRPLRDADIPTVQQFIRAAYEPYDGLNESYLERLTSVAQRAATATAVLVAEPIDERGQAVGPVVATATLCAAGNQWADIAAAGELEMRMLAVSPTMHGRGVGHTMVRAVQRYAQDNDYEAVVLSSREEMTAAHRLYERCGFELVPERFWEPVPGLIVRCYRWKTP